MTCPHCGRRVDPGTAALTEEIARLLQRIVELEAQIDRTTAVPGSLFWTDAIARLNHR